MTQPAASTDQPVSEDAIVVAGARRLVGVQFRRAAAMVYDFEAGDLPLAHDTRVVVETDKGEAIGWTVGTVDVREPHSEGPLRRVLRVATDADVKLDRTHHSFEHEALRFCAQRARQLGLSMKVVAVELAHTGEKAAFYFSSEDRIDFRALVKDLAQKFRLRVEMRQVGPRDEAKIIGAMGPCGRETCCSSWLRAFTPVSIKMAKDQGLALNPQKVTGVCGRLLCCLAYEQETYKDLRRKLPRLGKIVVTPRGNAKVIDLSVLRGRVRVVLEGGEFTEFDAAECRAFGGPAQAEEPDTDSDASETVVEAPPARVEAPRLAPRQAEATRPRPTDRGERPRPPERTERPAPNHPRPQGERPQRPPQERREQPRPPRPEQPRQAEAKPQQQQQRPQQGPQQPRPPRPENRRPQPPPPPKQANPASEPEQPKAEGETQGEGGQRHRRRRRRGGGGGPKMPNDGGSGSDSE